MLGSAAPDRLCPVTITLTPPHDDLRFMTALSQQRADRLVRFVAMDLTGTVLDIGCGWAELLLQVLAAAPEARGLGIDLDAAAIEHGRGQAAQRGMSGRVELTVADARTATFQADAVLCIGATQVWGSDPMAGEPLDYAAALGALRAVVPRGGRVVYGEAIWSAPPTEAAAAALSGRLDEMIPLADLVDVAVSQRFLPVGVHEASQDEWDDFESGYSACYPTWLATHEADDPDAAEVRDLARRQREAYFRGYRGVLGMAYLALVAI